MSCDSTSSTYLALRSVLFWPLQLLGTAALKLTTLLLALHAASLQARMQTALEPTPEPSDDDFDPATDDWCQWLDEDYVIQACIPHLNRCLDLDSHRHTHS